MAPRFRSIQPPETKNMLSAKRWCFDVVLHMQELAALLHAVPPLAPQSQPPCPPLRASEARALADLLQWFQVTAYSLMPLISTHDYSFADSEHYAPGAVPRSEFRDVNHVKRADEKRRKLDPGAPATDYKDDPPLRVYMLDLMGLTLLKIYDALAQVKETALARCASTLTFGDMAAEVPNLEVLCSGHGIICKEHAKVTSTAQVPETEYFGSVLPADVAKDALLTTLTMGQVAQILQVVNFARMSMDFRGRLAECLRVLALRVAVLVRTQPPAVAPTDIIRRQVCVLVGLLYIAHRVRTIPRQKEIHAPPEKTKLVAQMLAHAAETIRVSEGLMVDFVTDILTMMISRWDRTFFSIYDTVGVDNVAFIAPEIWRRTYASIYAFLKDQTFGEMWSYANLAPQHRVIAGVYLFNLLYTTQHKGDTAFLKWHVRLEDPVTDGTPGPRVKGQQSPRLIGKDEKCPPVIVCVGNIFGVYYEDTLHTCDNDFVVLLHFFLETLKKEGAYTLGVENDLSDIFHICGVKSDEEKAQEGKEERAGARRMLGILKEARDDNT